MEPWERVNRAYQHKAPLDRAPVDIYLTPEATEALRNYLGVDCDEAMLQKLGIDIRSPHGPVYAGPEYTRYGDGSDDVQASIEDILGIGKKTVAYKGGSYQEIVRYPLADAQSVEDVHNHPWPDPDWWDYSHIQPEIERLNANRRYWIRIFGGAYVELSWRMRGQERFLMDLAIQPEICCAIMDHILDFMVGYAERILDAADGLIDEIYTGGDVGCQRGMIFSPELWNAYYKPRDQRLYDVFKKHGAKVMHHSCGSIVPIIGELTGIGVDVLNPVQWTTSDMDRAAIKRVYGDILCFNGGIDVQHTLPHGSPDDVRAEADECMATLGRSGGYVLAPMHNIQPDTPPGNIVALYEHVTGEDVMGRRVDTNLDCSDRVAFL